MSPIDSSIYDRLIQPLQKPDSPLAIMQGVANLRDTQALAEDRRALVQERIRAAQEDGQIRQVMADQTVDMPTKIQRLYAINPKTAGDVQQSWDTSQKNHTELVKTVGDNAARALALYDPKDPPSWDHARAVASAAFQTAGMAVPQEYQNPQPPTQDQVDRWMMSKASLDEQIKAKQKHFEKTDVLGPDNKTVTLQNFDPSTGQVAPVTTTEGQPVLSPKTAELANTAATQARIEQHQTTQEGMERQRLGLEGARVGMERQRMNAENQATTAAAQASNPNAPHGDEFLKSLPTDADRAMIKALDEGRMQFPGSFALKTPYWQQRLSWVAQYDPNFDQVNYNSRAATRKDFTSGKSAQQINAINTAIGHLSQLSDLADALHNKDWNTYNSIANSMMTEFGWTGKTDYDTVLGRVAPEITRVWRGTGGNESDIKRDIDTLNSSRAGGQIHGSIANLGDMLKSKIDSSAEQYAQGMGTKPVEMTTPQAAATLAKLSKRAGRSESSSAPAGYQVGQVVSVKGKPIKITKVNTDGTFEGLPQ